MKLLKLFAVVLMVSFVAVSCEEAAEEADEQTMEEQTTNMDEQMKVVQPVVDSVHEAAAAGDSSMLKDEKTGE